MQITINAYWLYGFFATQLGEYKLASNKRSSEFHWLGEVHPSSWAAANSLYKTKKCNEFIKTPGGDAMLAVKIEAEIDRVNALPEQSILDEEFKRLREALEAVGFKDLPEPKLYFMVSSD